MIFGTLTLEGNRLHTHNDTYVLSQITTISARRPFLGVGISIATLLSVFGPCGGWSMAGAVAPAQP